MAWIGFFKIIRPINCTMMGLAVIVGGVIASGTITISVRLLLGFLTGFSLAGVINILNDVYDLELDRINRPDRPLPSGQLGTSSALAWASILSVIGLISAAFTSTVCLIVAAFSTLLGFLYNAAIKRTGLLGNIVVALIVAVPFIYGWLAEGGGGSSLVWLFSSTAFCAILGREIVKGIADVKGDAQKGVRTIAVVKGMRTAAFVTAALFIFSVLLSFFPLLMKLVSPIYLALVIPTDIGFILSSLRILGDPSSRTAYVEKNRALVWMTLALFAFLVGGVT